MTKTAPRRPIITLKAKPKPPEAPVEANNPTWIIPAVSKTALAKARLKAATAWLEATWPLAFRSPIRPLAVGAGEEVRAHSSGDFTADERHVALRAWTRRHDYQKAIIQRRTRVKLDGEDGGAVTDSEREHALERLKTLSERGPTKRAAATNSGPRTTSRTTTIQTKPRLPTA